MDMDQVRRLQRKLQEMKTKTRRSSRRSLESYMRSGDVPETDEEFYSLVGEDHLWIPPQHGKGG